MSDIVLRRTNFQLPAVKNFDEEFEIKKTIGKGNFGAVYSAVHKESDYLLAVKRLHVEVQSELAELQREITIMQQCDCPFVVRYYGHFIQKADKGWDMFIFMEFCSLGSLRDVLHVRKRGFEEPEIAMICRYVLLGLLYLHFNKKIHRDIKADNVLVNSAGEAKLADFGVSGQMEHTMAKKNTLIGTPVFIAPEVIVNDEGYNAKVDIWSLGITLIELAETVPPYHNQNPMTVLMTIPTAPPPVLKDQDKWSPLFHSFLAACLTKDPEQRPAADMLLNHPFILEHTSNCEKIMTALVEEISELKESAAEEGADLGADEEHRKKRIEAEKKLRAEAPAPKKSKSEKDEDKTLANWSSFQQQAAPAASVKVKDEAVDDTKRREKERKAARRARRAERKAAKEAARARSGGSSSSHRDGSHSHRDHSSHKDKHSHSSSSKHHKDKKKDRKKDRKEEKKSRKK
eukprot:CAMPEP_0168589140 /NCGR_PEP_ID=MMETSP0420-20121227/5854_1 /TAXON_ID=498008 /ORGANISM="Pessonella sp." /LENGTH=458 /DNA_ID=CAMNT_0008624669 /DNA_START=331 /DNA_END=1707 /DNA_ORIENTATION=-